MEKAWNRDAKWFGAALTILLLWLGMVMGVSFLATPAKFLAADLSLAVALDVGQHTFAVFNRVEWAFTALLLLVVIARVRTPLLFGTALLAVLLVAAETFWLLPALGQRVGMVMDGQPLPPSPVHTLYVIAESVKALVFAVAALAVLRRLIASPASSSAFQTETPR